MRLRASMAFYLMIRPWIGSRKIGIDLKRESAAPDFRPSALRRKGTAVRQIVAHILRDGTRAIKTLFAPGRSRTGAQTFFTAPMRNSLFPSGPVIGLSAMSMTRQPGKPSSQARMRSQTS